MKDPYAPPPDSHNPYAPPEARELEVEPSSELARAEAIRREHIKHEASVKSIGCLHLFGGVLTGFAAVTGLTMLATRQFNAEALGMLGAYTGVAGALIASGIGLRMLKPWAKPIAGILCAIGLIGFPIGTILNGYFLWLLFSAKGDMVFSERYKHVITATPHVKYVPWLAIIFLALLLGLFAFLIIGVRL